MFAGFVAICMQFTMCRHIVVQSAADAVIRVCLAECLLHSCIASKQLLYVLKLSSPSGSHIILVFPYETFQRGPHLTSLTAAPIVGGVLKKSGFSTNISLYFGNNTRQSYSSMAGCHDLKWPWVTYWNIQWHETSRSLSAAAELLNRPVVEWNIGKKFSAMGLRWRGAMTSYTNRNEWALTASRSTTITTNASSSSPSPSLSAAL